MMEYNAASVKFLLWHVETKETAKLLQEHSFDEIRRMVLEDNIYQQKSRERAQSEFSCIKKRLQALPEELIQKLIQSDIQTTKIITFIACMVTDRLLFELMYEVYRNKVHYGEENITDADLNIFMNDKRDQSEKMAGFSDLTIRKLKQNFCFLYQDWTCSVVFFINRMSVIMVVMERSIQIKWWYAKTIWEQHT